MTSNLKFGFLNLFRTVFGGQSAKNASLGDRDERTLSDLGIAKGQVVSFGDKLEQSIWGTMDPMLPPVANGNIRSYKRVA